jgi:transposase
MVKRARKTYTLEYKQQAVDLARQIGISKTARQLGVGVSSIHQWKKDLKQADSKQEFDKDSEIKRLKKENDELKKVNYILKRAAAFFSQDQLK